nr:MAG TPA: hypothetical protein [Caudoviricetes sp.]
MFISNKSCNFALRKNFCATKITKIIDVAMKTLKKIRNEIYRVH